MNTNIDTDYCTTELLPKIQNMSPIDGDSMIQPTKCFLSRHLAAPQNYAKKTFFFEARLRHMEEVKTRAKKQGEVQLRRLTTSPAEISKGQRKIMG